MTNEASSQGNIHLSNFREVDSAALYKKIFYRLIPFLFICYVSAYLDRVNVGFAIVQMKSDLAFSDAVYGLGAGIFFIGYFIFEVPSNLLLMKIGAKKTIMRIMLGWGAVSIGFMFIQTPIQFYGLRFLLGMFEAGFVPGVIFYLTFWFPQKLRGRIMAIFLSATAIAGVIGAPLSGWIMSSFNGVNGWNGWQWMFLLEGLPPVFLGIAAAFLLADTPADVRWLNTEEKRYLAVELKSEEENSHHHTMSAAFRDPRIYALALVYFTFACGANILSFWMPTIIKSYGISDPLRIGFLTAIPYIAAAVSMILVSRNSDRSGERRWHTSICLFLGAVGLAASTLASGNLTFALAMLTLATCGLFAMMPVFWTIPTAYLSSAAAASGIALINSIGLIGGFVSPTVIGWVKTTTGSTDIGIYLFSAVVAAGGTILLLSIPASAIRAKQN